MHVRQYVPLISLLVTLALSAGAQRERPQGEFIVLTYNVENLFDVDGVALFDDYQQDATTDPFGYSRAKLLTKLTNIATVLQSINDGSGPEIILFQELEADLTPESSIEDTAAFLAKYADNSVEAMLSTDWSPDYAGISSAAWLLKTLNDAGLTGYEVVTVPSRGEDSGIAHTNALFSKFPITEIARHPLVAARDIIEASIDVQGHPLVVYINHWKSGASNPSREPIRVENAKVLRTLMDQRLEATPQADIIIAGDLNAHYNQSLLFPDIETGINDVLGSSGDESFTSADLYNLWYELPTEARFSEVWRGRRGTLMHMLLSEGLYDGAGIAYVDGSYGVLSLPRVNADAIGRPLKWSFAGESGSGFSDHLPVYAHFKLGAFEPIGALSRGEGALDYELPLNVYDYPEPLELPDGAFLSALEESGFAKQLGRLFEVEARVLQMRPLQIELDGKVWPAYYANRSMIAEGGLPSYLKHHGGKVRLVVRPGYYRGKAQLVIESILGH